MNVPVTTSEEILEKLAQGASFEDLRQRYGFSRADFLTAALFGVAELHDEYVTILARRRDRNIP
jgi:uncharacterized protein (DUF433 family)